MAKRIARSVLGPARQARLENRTGPSKPTGSFSCSSLAGSGPKRADPFSTKKRAEKRAKRADKHVLVQKTGLEVNGSCQASPPYIVSCPSLARLFLSCRSRPA
jgi:hypothetical protein